MSLEVMARSVASRDDFVRFARALHDELKSNPQAWENSNLPSYLDGLASWSEDMEGFFRNIGEAVPEQPTWKLVAELLLAATMYE